MKTTTTTTMTSMMTKRIKYRLVAVCCCIMLAAIFATSSTISMSGDNRAVALSGFELAQALQAPLLWQLSEVHEPAPAPPTQPPQQASLSNANQKRASENWRQILSLKNAAPGQSVNRRFVSDDKQQQQQATSGADETRAMRSVGLRKIQRQLALIDPFNQWDADQPSLGAGILERALDRALRQQTGHNTEQDDDHDDDDNDDEQDDRNDRDDDSELFKLGDDAHRLTNEKRSATQARPEVGRLQDNRTARADSKQHEFIYVLSPISEQVLPFQSEKLAQGYKNFVSLAGPNYKTGLQKLIGVPSAATPAPDPIATNEAEGLKNKVLLLALGLEPSDTGYTRQQRLRNTLPAEKSAQQAEVAGAADATSVGCRPVRANVQISRDEFDMQTGQLVRQCTGLVSLNSCEGNCVSSVQPSIKSPTGFVKKCSCCNEGSFRRVQVRLNNCFLAAKTEPELVSATSSSGRQVSQAAPVAVARKLEHNFLDVIVNEPVDCKCRQCDNLI